MTRGATHGAIELHERNGVVTLRCDGWELMSSRAHNSEDLLGVLVCAHIPAATPAVLLGGLGLGFTLRALLDCLPADARVTVVELLPEVVGWAGGRFAHLAGRPLDDPRVTVTCADIGDTLDAMPPEGCDAVLLDVDNGPEAIMFPGNAALYDAAGLRRIRRALRPRGMLAVWSADRSARFEQALDAAGFEVEVHDVPARGSAADPLHVIYLARCAA